MENIGNQNPDDDVEYIKKLYPKLTYPQKTALLLLMSGDEEVKSLVKKMIVATLATISSADKEFCAVQKNGTNLDIDEDKAKESTQDSDVGSESKITRHPQDQQRVDFVRTIPLVWSDVDAKLKVRINESILRCMRGLDYSGRQKLMLLQSALHGEQSDEKRPKFREKLHSLMPLIDKIEREITEEEFNEELHDLISNLPDEKQRELLVALQQQDTDSLANFVLGD